MSTVDLVAYNLYRTFGFTNDDKFIESSIVTYLNNMSGDNQVEFTENYFYEEAVFTMYFLFEAESRYSYITSLINKLLHDGVINENPDFGELGMAFSAYAYFISCERMKLLGIPQTRERDEVLNFCSIRSAEYAKLMKASIEDENIIEENHPFEKYMQIIGNNISNSLKINNSAQEIIIYQLISTLWLADMEAGKKHSNNLA